MTNTKHELILKYIDDLEIGVKVSVRQVAKDLEVSEGTAYRAIKQAESKGLVSSIPKVGTIRIEEIKKKKLEDLSLQEIGLIVEGQVLCAGENLDRVPKTFIVGATTEELLSQGIDEQSLVIVGDVASLQYFALKYGASLLITNGAILTDELLEQAHTYNIPIIVTPYNTFLAISMINKAIYERLVQQELVRIGDIMEKDVDCLFPQDTISDWHELRLKSGHSRFPVVNGEGTLLGVISPMDITGMSGNIPIGEIMTTEMLTAKPEQLVSHLSRLLVWEACELVPVVNDVHQLVGVLSRQDIIQALQQTQKQPQFGETVDNLTLSGFKLEDSGQQVVLKGKITQFMVNEQGEASMGAIAMILSNAATIAARKHLKWQTAIEDFSFFQIERLNVEQSVEVLVDCLKVDKKSCKMEVVITSEGRLYGKAFLGLRWLKK